MRYRVSQNSRWGGRNASTSSTSG